MLPIAIICGCNVVPYKHLLRGIIKFKMEEDSFRISIFYIIIWFPIWEHDKSHEYRSCNLWSILSERLFFFKNVTYFLNVTTKILFFHHYPEIRIRIPSLSHIHTGTVLISFLRPYCLTDAFPSCVYFIFNFSSPAPLSPEQPWWFLLGVCWILYVELLSEQTKHVFVIINDLVSQCAKELELKQTASLL